MTLGQAGATISIFRCQHRHSDMATSSLTATRKRIAEVVRTLRRERAWTQAELAKRLGLSQSRLSEIENGGGSFTAEQYLLILKLFNVTAARFIDDAHDHESQIQNALARLGAHHLREAEHVLPSDDLDDVVTAVEETLCEGDPRHTTALAPVLVSNADRIRLPRIYQDLSRIGFERRLGWLCENTVEAISREVRTEAPRAWAQASNRAALVLELFVKTASRALKSSGSPSDVDLLDPSVRSEETLDQIRKAQSAISRKWRILSELQPEDFAQALRAARVGHS